MGVDDAKARQQLLERWTAEQRGVNQPAARAPSRTREALTRLRYRLGARSHRLMNLVFERGIQTAG
ncbi:MAG: hypothetical protein ACM31K_09085, partial [Solirubrobacterales bacterium]